MANRREEERERLRQAREERESSHTKSEQRRLYAAYGIAGVIGLAVVVGIVAAIASSGGGGGGQAHLNPASGSVNGFEPDEREGAELAAAKETDLTKAAQEAGCVVKLELRDEGKSHLPPTATPPPYGTNPPTSGNHAESPYQQADGAYSEMPDEIFLVHSLEHGRMEIQYSPDLSEDEQLELKGLYEEMYGGTLLFPNDKMTYAVAATTWTNLIGCPDYKGQATLDAIRAFGRKTWGRYGGEGTGAVKGPTPVEPQ
ncbi:MAG TPA: DUF3105 domain-containing protein [Solirubrobacterales bacterium]|nr:DUF3105 domain-containing protein [Solirubrobacterales bacterium]